VLLTLTLVAILALVPGADWRAVLRAYVLCMALLAPVLAAARIARAIVSDRATAEFRRWFQPWTAA
jgi:hypothetical protein